MSASTQYDIVTQIKVADAATGPVRSIMAQTTGMTSSMFKAVTGANLLAGAIIGGFTRAAHAVSGFASEIIGLNREFEDQKTSLAALINAYHTFTGAGGKPLTPGEGFKASLGMAGQQMQSFETAERTSPVTKEAMAEMAQAIMPQYVAAGGKLGDQLTALVTKAGTAAQLSVQGEGGGTQALMRLLMGKAQAGRNGLVQVLGLDSESLNKMKAPERLKTIQEALDRVITPETTAQLNESFSTVSRHFHNFIEDMKRVAGGRIFEAIKDQLKAFNEFMGANEESLTESLGAVLDVFLAIGEGLMQIVRYFASPIIGLIRYLGSGTASAEDLKNRLGATFQGLIESIGRFFDALVGNAEMGGKNFGETLNVILQVVTKFVDYFTLAVTALSAPFNLLLGYIQAIASAIYMIKAGGLGAIGDAAGLLGKGVKDATVGVGKDLSEATHRIIEPFASKVPGASGEGAGKNQFALGSAAVPKITQNFNGGITIKQEFKENADPDRIAFKVREVFEKLGENPIASRKRFSFAS